MQVTEPIKDETVLRLVVAGTASETGVEFFRALVKNLAAVMDTAGAWVTEYLPEQQRLRAHAFWFSGAFVEHFECDIAGTACAVVVEEKKVVHIPDRLLELYPGGAPGIRALNAVSYLGVPLLDTAGEVMGHLSVLDTKPLTADPRLVSLFEIFRARATAESRRLKVEQEVRAREQELSALLNNTMDAILVLDAGKEIVRVNPAAERLLGCTREDLIGESINDFLAPESATRVETLAKDLGGRPEGRQQLWVPQDFVARRWDHSVFPAEGTLSRFENRNETFYTLILRNSDDRLEAERQIRLLTQETEYLREAVREMPGHDDLLGRSDCMQAIFDAIKRVAKTDSTVLITGETGTGKELVARSIHRASNRADKPLVLVNCAAIPANLIESELFGHERGAFTGAVARRDGRFSLANGGTIFLDEVGELPLELQPKLLRVIQEGEFEPLGRTKTVKVDVRVVAATHRDLKRMCVEGKFRDDLYFRLHVFPIHIPPLRERGRDVEHLAAAFIQRFARRMGRRIHPLTDGQFKRLRSYDWPGNVRELQNVLERAMILSSGKELELERAMSGIDATEPVVSLASTEQTSRVFTVGEMGELERANIMRALEFCGGKVSGESGAARLLGIPATTLNSRMKALRVDRSRA